MKKKFIIFTLCFTLIFSSINYKKSYADGGVVSLPMLGVVSALGVGAGLVLNNNESIYDMGAKFYNWVSISNKYTLDSIVSVFNGAVALMPNNLVSVESDFLDIVKEFFNDSYSSASDNVYVGTIPMYPTFCPISFVETSSEYVHPISFSYKTLTIKMVSNPWGIRCDLYGINDFGKENIKQGLCGTGTVAIARKVTGISFESIGVGRDEFNAVYRLNDGSVLRKSASFVDINDPFDSLANNYGTLSWDNVDSKKENDKIALPIPGNLGDLVGQNKDTFWDNTDNLVGQGGLTIPGVDYPSIDVDTSINTFPSVDVPDTDVPDTDVPDTDVPGVDSPSVPNDGIWATIKEFIIGLVVPSDTYWTDTWGGLYNNFTNSFPMVDMDGFNDLVTGEKKFPNIDINIMGVSGRVVNGDVVNSIVNWLRPIVAGFMMLCLMLFNYRKIYKLIRNTEPFGGIAPGTSDFRTGISEYNKEPVIKAIDMNAEYQAWKERGGK